jgi:hypothetical protein
MRVGDNVREGPAIPDDPKKQNRKQFMARGSSQTLGGDPSMAHGTTRDGSPTAGFEDSMEFADSVDAVPLSMLQAKYKDLDPFDGARKSITEPTSPSQAQSLSSDQGSRAVIGSPGPAPIKPNPQQRINIKQLTGGYDNPGMRDRGAPITQIAPAARKKGAPPPPGQVTRLASGGSQMDNSSLLIQDPSSPVGASRSNIYNNSTASMGSNRSKSSKSNTAGRVKMERKDLSKALF